MNASTALLVVIALGLFIAIWIAATWLVSALGGWRALAERYRSDLPFTGQTWRMRSGRMGGVVRYNGLLTVGVNQAGLHLAVMPLFRPGHPPLFIPWPDVTVESGRRFFRTFVIFRFRQMPNVSLWLYEKFGRQVLETARQPMTMHAP